ncbi:MAG: metallophosphoesterase [Candidatus Aminicenantes bacterium]|nr:metallophosphoesterase [Candidatus Aminicenantes bacterium]NIM79182.1 metallophosphoesterase [Candidatus Aminicenantes bacterium]NIN18468.1 metallophosphoesterase [Candidatus Aminicenantes bacterium]NIN42356.1 metallophosphoesterase [Candidatus Aminicenantes bacterium]NIN85122.1 metallophosphoesterase [Candidatus Aminicenantes bacterium]
MIRILFLADTHLGFDLPFKPRVQRRRRGPDFFQMFDLALEPAHRGEVDAVIHGGDILFRSKVPPQLVQMTFEPLQKVADKGVSVFVVPGNHERSAIPFRLWASHPNIHIFVRPKTFYLNVRGIMLALAGFPYIRDNIQQHFPRVLGQTGWNQKPADTAVLCMHHIVEGAALQVGSKFYVFRKNPDIIRAADFPPGFAAVLSGHIHRFQVLTKDLNGNPTAVPIFYPGSTERTSFVEKDEAKGYLTLEIESTGSGSNPGGGKIKHWQFHELPARPMYQLEVQAANMTASQLESWIKRSLEHLPRDSVVKIRIHGKMSPALLNVVSAASLRSLAPDTMNVTIGFVNN